MQGDGPVAALTVPTSFDAFTTYSAYHSLRDSLNKPATIDQYRLALATQSKHDKVLHSCSQSPVGHQVLPGMSIRLTCCGKTAQKPLP